MWLCGGVQLKRGESSTISDLLAKKFNEFYAPVELTSVDWLDWLITIELFTIEDQYSLDREKEDKRNFDAAAIAGGGGGRV